MKITDNKISLYPLKKIHLEGGDILHALKESDSGYNKFGEVYFSEIKFNAIKAWKLHKSMTLNLVVPFGNVLFVFYMDDEDSFIEVKIGEENYQRLNVPPGIWFGFKGLNESGSLIMNLADMEHNPNELLRKSIDEFEYNW